MNISKIFGSLFDEASGETVESFVIGDLGAQELGERGFLLVVAAASGEHNEPRPEPHGQTKGSSPPRPGLRPAVPASVPGGGLLCRVLLVCVMLRHVVLSRGLPDIGPVSGRCRAGIEPISDTKHQTWGLQRPKSHAWAHAWTSVGVRLSNPSRQSVSANPFPWSGVQPDGT